MKSVFFGRHGKSSWDLEGINDEQRPLLPRGEKKTALVAEFLRKKGIKPDLIIASQAVRAYETAKIVAGALDYPANNIKRDRRIYDGPYDRILDMIYGTDPAVNSLMIFGHNPLITQLPNLFLSPGIDFMPTSAILCISFRADSWETISTVAAHMEFYVDPKMVKQNI